MQQSGGVIGFVVALNVEYITLTLTIWVELIAVELKTG